MKISELKGRPVVSMAEGRKVGVVVDARIDPRQMAVTSLTIGGDPQQGFLPLERIKSIGQDAITIDSTDAIQWATNRPMDELSRSASELMDLNVVDGSGTLVGQAREISAEMPSGKVTSIEVTKGGVFGLGASHLQFPVSAIVAVGPKLITVQTPAEMPS